MKKNFLLGGLMLLATSMMSQNTIDNAFFEKVNFRGAFGATDWTAGWSNFNPQTTVYPATTKSIVGNIATNTTLGSPLKAAASFADASLADPFFTQVDYIGAFGTTDWTSGWANFNPQTTVYPATTTTVTGDISVNTTWTKNNTYEMNGFIFVTNGATLTIEPGTVIRGKVDTKAALIITRGSKLMANGTLAEPIVFTSIKDAGSRAAGDWGGIVLLGKAQNNTGGDMLIEGGLVGATALHGGNDNADNSGSLQYVRIEYAGYAYAVGNEINGLTFGSVGSGTTIDYVQVSYANDDSYEWFGGAVNCKHLIAYAGLDDEFDTDNGFTGKVQFAVGLRNPNIDDESVGGTSNGFESDNNAAGTTALPTTAPVFCNVSMYGPFATPTTNITGANNWGRAMHIRRNSKLSVFNSVFAGYKTGLYLDGALTAASASAGDLKIKNCVLSGMTVANFGVPTGQTPFTAAAETDWFNTPAFANATVTNNTDLFVTNPFNLLAPNFTIASPAYEMDGFVFVNDGVTLTVKPGTVIRGKIDTKAALIITRGAKLMANGTVTEPIVFTSNKDAGSRVSGDWGGVVLLGKAQNNTGGDMLIEGGLVGATALHGGTDNADNSGSLKYVRIEYAGYAYAVGNEINGLTFGSVGSGTTIDNVQVTYANDDSFEWFGGAVNCKHLIAYAGLDDDFDTDNGFTGMIQFAVGLRDPKFDDESVGGTSNGFESDNNAAGTTATPITAPLFSNVSLFGPFATPTTDITGANNWGRAMHIRRNSKLQVYNSIFAGYKTGMYIDGNLSQANATAGDLKVRNCVLSGMTVANFSVPSGNTWNAAAARTWFNDNAFKNDTIISNTDLNITNPFNLSAPNFLPTASSKLNGQSYWNFKPATGLANNMALYVKAYANGSQVTTPGSVLIATKNGECRGSDEVMPDGSFMLLAMSDLATESDLQLQLYDRASRKIYNLPTVFDFESDSDIGTINAPATITATASLSIPLVTGNNWISFNVLPESSVSTKNVLNYTPTTGDALARQGGGTAIYSGGNWIGAITEIAKDKMYKLKCKGATPGSINVVNQPLVMNSAITLSAGVNWIGYSLVESELVSNVLSGYTASLGDKIATNAGGGQFATYNGSSWTTSKPTLVPGRGYTLKSANGGSLIFPRRVLNNVTPNRAPESGISRRAISSYQSIWSEPQGKANNMFIYAKVAKPDGSEFMPNGLYLGVFKGVDNYCYGVSEWFLDGASKIYLFGAQTDPTAEDGYFFKVYDAVNNTFYNSIDIPTTYDNDLLVGGASNDDKFKFIADGDFGAIDNPVVLKIRDFSTSNGQVEKSNLMVFDNKADKSLMIAFEAGNVNVDITLCDVQGRTIKQLLNGNVNGTQNITYKYNQLSAGLYIVRANIGGNVHTQKVILK